jgi:ribose transport system substrate-binding protein
MKRQLRKWAACIGTSVLAIGLLTGATQAADKKFKIFLSMSYIGNDWQAEAANMV